MDHDRTGAATSPQFLEACERACWSPPRTAFHRNTTGLVDLVFDLVDADPNGLIDLPEFTTWMHSYGVGPRDTVDAFDLLDSDDDGMISRAEMAAAEQFYALADPAVVRQLAVRPALGRVCAIPAGPGATASRALVTCSGATTLSPVTVDEGHG